MTKSPFAYVCTPGRGGDTSELNKIREYCRLLYEAGYVPIAPVLLFPLFLSMRVPRERKAVLEMTQALLRRCRVVVACGPVITDEMMCELMLARRLNITATTLDGILLVHRQKAMPLDKGKVVS